MKIIETERLILRQFSEDDSKFILEQLNEPSFIQNIGDRNVRNEEDAKGYLRNGPIASYSKNGFGLYHVSLKETGEVIGMCGLIKRDALEDVDIGYSFLPRFWGKGYAVEATSAIKIEAREIGLKRIVAIVDPANEGSLRVLEKIGFVFEKMTRLSDDDIDLKLLGIQL